MITRAHHDAAGMCIGKEVMDALEEATAEQERARRKGAARRNRTDRTEARTPGREERRRIRLRRKLRLKEALLGRSRGGLTSKIHLAADRRVPSVVVRPGHSGD